MPTATYFNKYPPFPKDIPIAHLPRISFSQLIASNDVESENLFEACRVNGFFLLDLKGSGEGEVMLKDAEDAFDLSEKVFEIDQKELMKDAFKPPKCLFGYKPSGQDKLDDGSPDCVEFYSFGQDHMLGTFPHKYPDQVEANRKHFQDFLHHAHDIVNHLLSHLDKHLALQPNTLASLIPQDRRSGTSLRLLKSKPQTVDSHRKYLASHTDIGAMTMLFNINGGLQLLPAGSENLDENWRYVRPEPGCALINLGDAMVQWSGGILRSNIHRVATPPGEQAAYTRYSIAYLVHPEANVSMRRLQGGGIIPRLGDGEKDEDVRAEEWGKIRVGRIISGKSIPASSGGVRLDGQKMQEVY